MSYYFNSPYNDNCAYAHGEVELRAPPPQGVTRYVPRVMPSAPAAYYPPQGTLHLALPLHEICS